MGIRRKRPGSEARRRGEGKGEGRGKGKGGEPVEKLLSPLFRPLVINLMNICQQDNIITISEAGCNGMQIERNSGGKISFSPCYKALKKLQIEMGSMEQYLAASPCNKNKRCRTWKIL